MHSRALAAGPDRVLAASFDYAGGCAETLRAEDSVVHAWAIAFYVAYTFAGLVVRPRVRPQRFEDVVETAVVEFVVTLVRPLFAEVTHRTEDRFRDAAQVLLCVEAIDDLNRLWKVLSGKAPDPRCAIAKHSAALRVVEAPPGRFAHDSRSEIAGTIVGVATRCAFDRGRVGDRARVAHWRASPWVAALRAPDRAQLHFTRLRRPIRLLAGSPHEFLFAHWNARTVHTEVKRPRDCGIINSLGMTYFVRRYFTPERLRSAFDVLRWHIDARQNIEQLCPLLEAHSRADEANHAHHTRRQRGAKNPHCAVSRTDPRTACITMVIGALERKRPERADKHLWTTADIPCIRATLAAKGGGPAIGVVGVDAAFNSPRRERECLATDRDFDGFEIERVERIRPDQGFDLGLDLGSEGFGEAPFLTTSLEAV